MRKLILSLLCIQFMGCASAYVISDIDQRAVKAGEKTIVLLRVQCEIDNLEGKAFGTSAWTGEPYVALGLGSFETIGEPRRVPHYFLSEETRLEGWTYFVVSPGLYYLAAVGPRSDAIYQNLHETPRWRIDVPENTGLVYAGSLHLSGRTHGTFLLGGKVVKPSDDSEFLVKDESDLAKNLLTGRFAETNVKTILMQRWLPGNPIIIRSPPADSKK